MRRIGNLLNHLSPEPSSCHTAACAISGTSPYRYTVELPDSPLTKEQRDFYEANGFLVIKKLVSEEDIEKWRQRFVDIAEGRVERAPIMTMMRDVAVEKKKEMGEHAITKIQDWPDDPVLFTFAKHDNVLKYVRAFTGPNVKSMHYMLINKPPDAGLGSSRHPPHQDLWYFPFRPAERIVCAWTAMQKIDRENGCLFVQPGSHRGKLQLHEYPDDGVVNKAYHGIQGYKEADYAKFLHVEMEPGDTIFFHPLLIHGSGRNNSTRFRKAISVHYASADCHYIDVDGTMQESIAREIEDIMKAKGVEDPKYVDVWRLKSRLVAGVEGTLQ